MLKYGLVFKISQWNLLGTLAMAMAMATEFRLYLYVSKQALVLQAYFFLE